MEIVPQLALLTIYNSVPHYWLNYLTTWWCIPANRNMLAGYWIHFDVVIKPMCNKIIQLPKKVGADLLPDLK